MIIEQGTSRLWPVSESHLRLLLDRIHHKLVIAGLELSGVRGGVCSGFVELCRGQVRGQGRAAWVVVVVG
jgi:hypothetical protein